MFSTIFSSADTSIYLTPTWIINSFSKPMFVRQKMRNQVYAASTITIYVNKHFPSAIGFILDNYIHLYNEQNTVFSSLSTPLANLSLFLSVSHSISSHPSIQKPRQPKTHPSTKKLFIHLPIQTSKHTN